MSAARWCFTLNNWTEEEHVSIIDFCNTLCKYAVVGKETGEAGTPHLQGFIILNRSQRLSFVRGRCSLRAHWEIARGTSQQAADYCKKENDYTEIGELAQRGRRTDIDEFKDWLASCGSLPSRTQIAQQFPSLYLRYSRRLVELAELLYPRGRLVDGELWPWQQQLSDALAADPDDRTIIFNIDTEGNKGKSWFCRWMLSEKPDDVQILSIGKRDDIAHVVDVTKSIFLFDVPRGSMEYLQYGVLEQLKNRVVFSPKYDSTTKILTKTPHVVVMCNEQPDMNALSGDRYQIINME